MDNVLAGPRRNFLLTSLAATAGLFVPAFLAFSKEEKKEENEVGANEDLMREHGVIRRALLVYQEASRRLRQDSTKLPLNSLLDTAKLFREFAEDYHERDLEEKHIFPVLHKLGGNVSKLTDTLLTQHNRGREITDYIIHVAAKSKIEGKDAEILAKVLDGFILMYEHHAAREDTVLFPVWKETIGPKNYAEMGEKFEAIEHQVFGHDGFEEAVRRISKIEESFGLSDINSVTAPPPPKS